MPPENQHRQSITAALGGTDPNIEGGCEKKKRPKRLVAHLEGVGAIPEGLHHLPLPEWPLRK